MILVSSKKNTKRYRFAHFLKKHWDLFETYSNVHSEKKNMSEGLELKYYKHYVRLGRIYTTLVKKGVNIYINTVCFIEIA